MAKTQKSKPRKTVRRRVRSKVSQAASIREYYDAVLANLDEAYWETATPVLEGTIPVDAYPSMVARLEALRDAGRIARSTLIERDEEERDDEEDEAHAKGRK